MDLSKRNRLIEKSLEDLGIDTNVFSRKRLLYGEFTNTLDCKKIGVEDLILAIQNIYNKGYAEGRKGT